MVCLHRVVRFHSRFRQAPVCSRVKCARARGYDSVFVSRAFFLVESLVFFCFVRVSSSWVTRRLFDSSGTVFARCTKLWTQGVQR